MSDAGMATAALDAEFGDDGACWRRNEDEQEVCRAACQDSLDAAAIEYPDISTCAGGGEEPTPTPTPDCADDIEPTGHEVGDIAEDIEGTDHNGDPFSLHAHCDRAVLYMSGALWDGGTIGMTAQLSEWHEQYEGQGLTIVVGLAENNANETPSTAELAELVEEYDLEYIVIADPAWSINNRYEQDSAIPTFVLFGPGAEIVHGDSDGVPDEDDIEASLP